MWCELCNAYSIICDLKCFISAICDMWHALCAEICHTRFATCCLIWFFYALGHVWRSLSGQDCDICLCVGRCTVLGVMWLAFFRRAACVMWNAIWNVHHVMCFMRCVTWVLWSVVCNVHWFALSDERSMIYTLLCAMSGMLCILCNVFLIILIWNVWSATCIMIMCCATCDLWLNDQHAI